MSGRMDIITRSQLAGTPQPIPPEHPLLVAVFSRVLTADHGPGKPSVTPRQLRGMADLIDARPCETVTLVNEAGEKVDQLIDYTADAVTGADLADNASPERVLTIMRPVTPADPHEPGLVVRLGYQIEGLTAVRRALNDTPLPPDAAQALQEEETRLCEWLSRIEEFERVMFPAA